VFIHDGGIARPSWLAGMHQACTALYCPWRWYDQCQTL